MLRKIRLTLAILFFACITLLFLDFTGSIHLWFGWMAKIQFLPAVLALNLGIVALLVVLTLVLGRVYCSVICPLGVFQDIVSWLNSRRKKKLKYRFSYSPALSWLRYTMLGVFLIALVAGISSLAALLAPYSSYGRIASNFFAPVYRWGNNLLAYFAERADSYAFYETDVWLKSLPTFLIALATLVVIVILAWRNGRTYCNTICPVGTALGFLSKYALFRITIDTDKCNACGLCSRRCKAACIDGKTHQVDYSRCVACMDCIDTCTHDAIHYRLVTKLPKEPASSPTDNTPKKGAEDATRRSFLTATALVATTALVKAQEKKVDGGLATIEDKKIPNRLTPILPPGAQSARHFAQHCTGCQLCVSACLNGVLRPSTDLMKLMQPEMSYERGYCRPECARCAEVCPTDAIHLTDLAEKSATQIGHAVWVKQNCVVLTDGVECGNCARHCPTGAIQMIPLQVHHRHRHRGGREEESNEQEKQLLIPAVNVGRCIGCGACENLCPARPFSAIYVEGHEVQRTI